MTLYSPYEQKVKCANCRKVSLHRQLESTHCFGYSDLDFRPAPAKRYTLFEMYQMCPHCYFVNSMLSQKYENSTFFSSVKFKEVVENLQQDDVEDKLIKFWILAKKEQFDGNYDTAARFYLIMAWWNDDCGNVEKANKYRRLAVESFQEIPVNELGVKNLAVIDALRRLGEFDKLDKYVAEFKKEINFQLMAVQFQSELACAGDKNAYTIKEVMDRIKAEV